MSGKAKKDCGEEYSITVDKSQGIIYKALSIDKKHLFLYIRSVIFLGVMIYAKKNISAK